MSWIHLPACGDQRWPAWLLSEDSICYSCSSRDVLDVPKPPFVIKDQSCESNLELYFQLCWIGLQASRFRQWVNQSRKITQLEQKSKELPGGTSSAFSFLGSWSDGNELQSKCPFLFTAFFLFSLLFDCPLEKKLFYRIFVKPASFSLLLH